MKRLTVLVAVSAALLVAAWLLRLRTTVPLRLRLKARKMISFLVRKFLPALLLVQRPRLVILLPVLAPRPAQQQLLPVVRLLVLRRRLLRAVRLRRLLLPVVRLRRLLLPVVRLLVLRRLLRAVRLGVRLLRRAA
jgi:hypothetical protein